MAILAELKDPRVRDVTVTYVEVAGDLRNAKVYVSIMGDEKRQSLSLRGLQNSAGFLQAKCSQRIDMRYTPRLTFVLDQGVKHSIEIARILNEVLPPDKEGDSSPTENDSIPVEDEPKASPSPDEIDAPGEDASGEDASGEVDSNDEVDEATGTDSPS